MEESSQGFGIVAWYAGRGDVIWSFWSFEVFEYLQLRNV